MGGRQRRTFKCALIRWWSYRSNSSEDYTSRPSNVNDPTERDVGVGSSVGATGSGSKNEGKLAHCSLVTVTVSKNGQYENQFRRWVASK